MSRGRNLNRRVDPQVVEALDKIDRNLAPVYRELREHFAGRCTGQQLLDHLRDRFPGAVWVPSQRTLLRWLRDSIKPTEEKFVPGSWPEFDTRQKRT